MAAAIFVSHGVMAQTPAHEAGKPAAAAPVATPVQSAAALTMEQYLDRLMMAESGGRLDARNSRSTAVGPYQFIEGTFIEVARRNFASETVQLTAPQLLAKRTDPVFARRVAEAYTRETASLLASNDVAPTWQHLRLAFIVGPTGAVRLLKSSLDAPLTGLLTPAALNANPFMAGSTVRTLLNRAAREVSVAPSNAAGVEPGPVTSRRGAVAAGVVVRCNLSLPSCRKWVGLKQAAAPRLAGRLAKR